MSLEGTWNAAKKAFETATGKKKPSGKFMGVFHTSGVSDALKKLDTAIAKGVQKDMENGLVALGKAASTYVKALEKEDKADDTDYSAEMKKLIKALEGVSQDAGLAVNTKIRELAEASQKDAADAASKAADAASKAVKTLFDGARNELRTMEKLSDDADDGLRAVVTAQSKADAKAAKTSAEKVKIAASALAASQKKMEAGRKKAGEAYSRAAAEIKKLDLPKGRNAASGTMDTVDAMVMKMDDFVRDGATELADGEKAWSDAQAALKGAFDMEATYVKSCEKLQKRAMDAAMEFDGLARDVGGQADRAGQEVLTADEASDDAARAQSLKVADMYIKKGRAEATAGVKEIEAAAREIKKTRDAMPDFVNARNPKFADALAKVADFMESLKESRDALNKALGKFDKAEASATKLAA